MMRDLQHLDVTRYVAVQHRGQGLCHANTTYVASRTLSPDPPSANNRSVNWTAVLSGDA